MAVKPIPDGYHTVTPYLIVNDAVRALDFYKQAFGATELFRMQKPDGKIGHAEIKIGDSPIMLADEHPEVGAKSPQSLGGAAVSILLYVKDADAMTEQAVAAGAKVCARYKTSSTAIARRRCPIRSGTPGMSPRTSRTLRPRKCKSASRRRNEPQD